MFFPHILIYKFINVYFSVFRIFHSCLTCRPQIIKKLIERKQAQIRKVYPGLSCFKEGVRQIPIESIPGIRTLLIGNWRDNAPYIFLTRYLTFILKCERWHWFMVSSYKQVKLAGSLWAKGTCYSTLRDSNLAGGPFHPLVCLAPHHCQLVCVPLCFRKELKDPDQLYSTLKTILQHVKVRGRSHINMQERLWRINVLCSHQTGLYVSQSHQNAWPFMEPVKKTEAPGYYQVIRFPMGTYAERQEGRIWSRTHRPIRKPDYLQQ